MAGGAGFYDITVGANLIVLVITFWPGRFFYFDDRLLSAPHATPTQAGFQVLIEVALPLFVQVPPPTLAREAQRPP